jgi:hypothetical protein
MEPQDAPIADSSPATQTPVEQPEQRQVESFTPEERDAWLSKGEYPKPQTADSAPASAGQNPETAPASEAGKADTKPEPRQRPTGEDRKAQLRAEIDDLLRQRAQLRQELAQRGAHRGNPPAPQAQPQGLLRPTRPKVADFEDYDAYETALDQYEESLADYKAAQRIEAERASQQRQQQEQAIEQRNAQVKQAWETRVSETVNRRPDFTEVVAAAEIALKPISDEVNPEMNNYILNSRIGPDLVYHLAQNPAEVQRIAQLGPYDAMRELALIEHSLSQALRAPLTKKITAAKPPPTELTGTNKAPEDEAAAAVASGNFRAYMDSMNAREATRYRR